MIGYYDSNFAKINTSLKERDAVVSQRIVSIQSRLVYVKLHYFD